MRLDLLRGKQTYLSELRGRVDILFDRVEDGAVAPQEDALVAAAAAVQRRRRLVAVSVAVTEHQVGCRGSRRHLVNCGAAKIQRLRDDASAGTMI